MDYSLLPKVDQLLSALEKLPEIPVDDYNRPIALSAGREAIQNLRMEVKQFSSFTREALFAQCLEETLAIYKQKSAPSLRRVINATGIVLHTNLGRSPLAKEAIKAVAEVAGNYCNLEINLTDGKRSSRYDHLSNLLRELTGAEDALVVNNNAAAVLLTLDTLTCGGEAIVSRGQLVEIGGSFRIPDIMRKSGTVLREVGTTNKTYLSDYKNAINENTKALVQVHPSNFTMSGFVEEVAASDLAGLAHAYKLPLIYDLGSGCLFPFSQKGIGKEPHPEQLIKDGADILTFSGDKLLGGPQAGIIIGKKKYIDIIKKNPLTRALRVDKFTVAALETTLRLYQGGRAGECIPTIAMLTAEPEALKEKGEILYRLLIEEPEAASLYEVNLLQGISPVGGGSLPGIELPAYVLEISPKKNKAAALLSDLREGNPAILGYIQNDKALFDVRTIDKSQLCIVAAEIMAAARRISL